jgi:SsrA-binding protein
MKNLTENKRAYFDFEILETFEAGLVLQGFEVKSIRLGRAKLQGAFVIIRNEEGFLVGMHIPPYQAANTPEWYKPDRTRKLLLTKREIRYFIGKTKEQGLTLVPIRVYSNHALIKLEFGLARGKKALDKRQKIREREETRRIERTLKNA